jgi:orotidine-5'-phosphate decarboxylase
MIFTDKLSQAVRSSKSTVCVGLDPNLALLPNSIKKSTGSAPEKVERFLKKVIDATQEHCAAFKPNLGFFEALGTEGWQLFEKLLNYIPDEKIIIADAKRGDISSTAEHYAKAFFERLKVDAITLNPLMGFETLDPFLNDAENGVYVLTLTSNPGAKDLLLKQLSNGELISSYISRHLSEKQNQSNSSIGMVVGATQASDLKPVIENFPESPLLIPGIGTQGGSVSQLADVLCDHSGIPLVNSSRSIIYAGSDKVDWSNQVAQAAQDLKTQLEPITERYV